MPSIQIDPDAHTLRTGGRRRRRRLLAVLGAVALLAGACGGDSDSADPPATASAPSGSDLGGEASAGAIGESGSETADAAEPTPAASDVLTVEHAGGTTEVPSEAETILALDENAAFILWELGLDPEVVYGSYLTTYTSLVADDRGVEIVPHSLEEPSIEASAALAPDVIIGTDHPATVASYDLWGEVGPTVLFPYREPWEVHLDTVAAAFGLEDVADQRADRLQADIDRIAAEIDVSFDSPPTVSIVFALGGSPFALPDTFTATADLLDELGIERPEAQRVEVNESFPFVPFSPETLTDHDADFVIVAGGGIYEDMSTFPLFPSLTGTTTVVEGEYWLAASHPFAISWILADIEAVVLNGGEPRAGADTLSHWTTYTG
ncbi:MAG: ABC transporter substrate-binding protein [Actinomycetota bacterium]